MCASRFVLVSALFPFRLLDFFSYSFRLSFVIGYSVSIITDTAREKKSKTAKPSSYILCLLYKFTSFYWIFSRISYARKNKTFFTLYMLSQYECRLFCRRKKMKRSAKYFFFCHITLSSVFASRRFPSWINLILIHIHCKLPDFQLRMLRYVRVLRLFAHNSLLVFFASGKICVIK